MLQSVTAKELIERERERDSGDQGEVSGSVYACLPACLLTCSRERVSE